MSAMVVVGFCKCGEPVAMSEDDGEADAFLAGYRIERFPMGSQPAFSECQCQRRLDAYPALVDALRNLTSCAAAAASTLEQQGLPATARALQAEVDVAAVLLASLDGAR